MYADGHVPVFSVSMQKQTLNHYSTFTIPDARFDIVHIELVGPLPPSKGFTYLFMCIDRFTRWPEAIPLTSATTEAIACALTDSQDGQKQFP